MKALKIILKTLAALAGLVIVIVLAGSFILRRSGLPKLEGEQRVAGLTGEVNVLRDERGVPHIYSTNTHDLYFMTGYLSAQERLWQMDLIRRATKGRLSEIFGPDYIDTDHFLRLLDMSSKSAMVLSREDPEILEVLQAYCDGVNAWITSSGRNLPPEFRVLGYRPEPWTMTDITNIIGYMGWELARDNLDTELRNYKLMHRLGPEKFQELMPDWELVKEVVFPEFKLDETLVDKTLSFISSLDRVENAGVISFSGSNNWALSGNRSETGKPILSNDMHLGLSVPGFWIQMHQVIPGELDVTGVMVPGQPFIVAGHNDKIAWGLTNLMVDDIDVFVETVDSAGNYLFNNEWLPLKEREETIAVKGGETVKRVVRSSHRGPVISELRNVDDAVFTMRWSGYDYSDEIKAVYLLDRAGSWNEFRSAISNFRSVSQNFAYADAEGNIGLNTGGGIPIRKGPWTYPRPGSTDEYDWQGYVPFESLPSSFNPVGGFVSSANQRTVNESYPYYIAGDFAMPFRINRIRQMASENEIMGIDDFKRMITDNKSDYAASLTPIIVRYSAGIQDPDRLETAALSALSSWDYRMDKSIIAPTIFEFTRSELIYKLLHDELGDLYGSPLGKQYDHYLFRIMKEGPDEWVDDINTPGKESFEELVAASFRSAVDTLQTRYGTDTLKWQWGRIHTIKLQHPMGGVKPIDMILRLNSKRYRIGGSYHTVEPYAFNSLFEVNHGASERHIFNTADWDKSLTVIPTGTSGNPGSPFYLSQTDAYLNNRFYSDPFSIEAVQAAGKYKMKFVPAE